MLKLNKIAFILLSLFILAGCFVIGDIQLDNLFGPEKVQQRITSTKISGPDYYTEVKPILENRCVVCHACYDAPCQLKT